METTTVLTNYDTLTALLRLASLPAFCYKSTYIRNVLG